MKESRDRLEVAIKRDYKVVKANEIIQRAKFDLSILEQKTFCYCVSKIKPSDTKDTEYVFSINEYCDVCGIHRNDGRTIENVKDALKKLRDKSFYLVDEDGSWVLIGWLSKARILPKSGKIKIKFDEDMQKYLMGLYANYTQYSLLCVLPMRSAYSIRLYELLKSYVGLKRKEIEFDVDELKIKLNAPYVNFKDFRKKSIEVATREINLYADIEITWEPIKKGKKVVTVKFLIKNKGTWNRYVTSKKASDQLDGQMSIEDLIGEHS